MTIETVFETEQYRYDYDTLYGTGWFVRKADDHVSLMNTGVEAEEIRLGLINRKPCPVDFDAWASHAEYTSRWEQVT